MNAIHVKNIRDLMIKEENIWRDFKFVIRAAPSVFIVRNAAEIIRPCTVDHHVLIQYNKLIF